MKNMSMSHFVLIHGASHGAWCWYKLRCLMETSGYKVTSLDLTSGGIDPTDANTISTFEDYNEPLTHLLLNLPDNEKVILVGHSAGGLNITDAIHRFGCNKIRMAIYIAANMLKHGFITDQDYHDMCCNLAYAAPSLRADPDLSEYGDVSEEEFMLGPDNPPTSTMLKKEFQQKLLYQMSPTEDSTLASMLVRPAPVMAFRAAQFTEGPDADKVPRVYIKTLNDRVLKLQQQDAMITRWPPSQVFDIESDHSPFFSNPFVLFGFLVKVAASTN